MVAGVPSVTWSEQNLDAISTLIVMQPFLWAALSSEPRHLSVCLSACLSVRLSCASDFLKMVTVTGNEKGNGFSLT